MVPGAETFLRNERSKVPGAETFLENDRPQVPGAETFLKKERLGVPGADKFFKNDRPEVPEPETFPNNEMPEVPGAETFLKSERLVGGRRCDIRSAGGAGAYPLAHTLLPAELCSCSGARGHINPQLSLHVTSWEPIAPASVPFVGLTRANGYKRAGLDRSHFS